MSTQQPDEEAIFELARQMESPQLRDDYVEQACGNNTALRERIRALLGVYDKQADFLELPPSGVDATIDQPLTERPGMVVGNYKLMERLGEGGMGVVYVADQQRPIRRRVALKLIKPGLDTEEVLARFTAERQALALMDHPNIAKVYDAGATDTGRPFFVMELVRGIPITEYCDLNRFSACKRLDVFVDVCQAVQHAHQKGIIHRDLKPSNVLITEHDGTPVVKVIDFGVAKAMNQQLSDRTVYTRHQQMVGTPMYMSPEQAAMSGLDVDTRSDVYSLGVLLYELLSGTTPFEKARLNEAAYDEIRRIIREEEPQRPSTKLSSLQDEERSTAAKYRASAPPELIRLLKGDLDWIVMKCLEKDRKRRYQTASGLAADVRRHLEHEPVVARPPSAIYRCQKAWNRHRVAFGVAALVAACLIGAVMVSSLFAVREHKARKAESAERERAVRAEQEATTAAERNLRLSYFSDVNLAHRIYRSGDRARATALLMRYLPGKESAARDLRGFEWHYLWDLCRGRSAQVLPGEGMVYIAFSPDGRTLATGGSDGMLRIWDRASVTLQREFAIDPDPDAQYRTIHPLYSPSGGILAGLFRRNFADASGRVVLWDVEKETAWSLASGSPNDVVQLAFQANGKTLLTAERNGQIRSWDASNGQPMGEPKQIEEGANWHHAAFSPDLRLLAVGASQASPTPSRSELIAIRVYDLETGHARATFQREMANVGRLHFTEDGRFLVGTNYEKTDQLVIWDIKSGEEVLTRNDIKGFDGIASVSREEVAVGGSDSITILKPATGEEVERWSGIPGIVFGLAVSPDRKQLASAGWDGIVRLWDLPRQENPLTLPLDESTTSELSFSPSGDLLATAQEDQVTLRSSADLQGVHTLAGQTLPVFSPVGERLATVSARGDSIHIWDPRSGRETGPAILLEGHRIERLAFTANGRLIGCGSDTGEVILLDVATRRIQERFGPSSATQRNFFAIGTNPQGQHLIALPGGERTVKLLNLSNEIERSLEAPTAAIWGVSFSPDGRHLAACGSDIVVWNTTTGEVKLIIEEITGASNQVSFSPDGESILNRGWDESLGIWDLRSGREKLRLLEAYSQTVQSATFSPDGDRIVAGVNHRSLMTWSASRTK